MIHLITSLALQMQSASCSHQLFANFDCCLVLGRRCTQSLAVFDRGAKKQRFFFCIFAFLYSTFSLLLFQCNTKYIYLNARNDAESPVFLRFEICSDAIFRIQPTALPRPQPPPALLGDSVAASSNPEVGLKVGVGGGVRDTWCDSRCVFQVKVKLEVGVASGVSGRPFRSSFPWLIRFRSDGRLVHRRSDVFLEEAQCWDKNKGKTQLCWWPKFPLVWLLSQE